MPHATVQAVRACRRLVTLAMPRVFEISQVYLEAEAALCLQRFFSIVAVEVLQFLRCCTPLSYWVVCRAS